MYNNTTNNGKMSITKVSSLETISSAMDKIYKKRAQGNPNIELEKKLQRYYESEPFEPVEEEVAGIQVMPDQHIHSSGSGEHYKSAMRILKEKSDAGNVNASNILRAFHGYGDKNKTLYLREREIGLNENQALAIVEPLKAKGFKNVDWKTVTYADNPYKKSQLNSENEKFAQTSNPADQMSYINWQGPTKEQESLTQKQETPPPMQSNKNYFSSAQLRLNEAKSKGFTSADNVLRALQGTGNKSEPINLKDPMLGLNEQEAYALAGHLKQLGYQVSTSTNWKASGSTDLRDAMERAVNPSSDSRMAKNDNPDMDEDATSSYPTSSLQNVTPVDMSGQPATAGPPPNVPGPLPHSINSKILDTIEKIANVLDEASFYHSAKVADDLLIVFAKEAIKKEEQMGEETWEFEENEEDEYPIEDTLDFDDIDLADPTPSRVMLENAETLSKFDEDEDDPLVEFINEYKEDEENELDEMYDEEESYEKITKKDKPFRDTSRKY